MSLWLVRPARSRTKRDARPLQAVPDALWVHAEVVGNPRERPAIAVQGGCFLDLRSSEATSPTSDATLFEVVRQSTSIRTNS
jgi:hypothetical protein